PPAHRFWPGRMARGYPHCLEHFVAGAANQKNSERAKTIDSPTLAKIENLTSKRDAKSLGKIPKLSASLFCSLIDQSQYRLKEAGETGNQNVNGQL
ncbi:hypothetical protein, partial [Lacticaseibacillus zeae]|uniref:hypothetical protein n=1 Tax=Lacticaseibacillus zeae TaxID=57037 RepID=UPI003B97C67B